MNIRNPITCLAIAAAIVAAPAVRGASGFLEPPVTFFGKVSLIGTGGSFQIYSGSLSWTFVPPPGQGDAFTVEGELENISEGTYSYRLRIPVQVVPAGFFSSTDAISSTPSDLVYGFSVEVDGAAAVLSAPGGGTAMPEITFSELLRGTFTRIDLEVAGDAAADRDGDGLSDLYEMQFASILDPDNPEDALEDHDGDGLPTIAEFFNGTDPSCYEYERWLANNGLSGAPAALSACLSDPDFDGMCNLFEYGMGGDPRTPDRTAVFANISFGLDPGSGEMVFNVNLPGSRHCAVDYEVQLSEGDLSFEALESGSLPSFIQYTRSGEMLEVRDGATAAPGGPAHRAMRLNITEKP